MIKYLVLFLFLFSLPVFANAAPQRLPCGKRAVLIANLETNYKETLRVQGLQTNGQMVEIFTTKDGSTFTILSSMPTGISCIVSAGENLIFNEYKEPKDDNQSL